MSSVCPCVFVSYNDHSPFFSYFLLHFLPFHNLLSSLFYISFPSPSVPLFPPPFLPFLLPTFSTLTFYIFSSHISHFLPSVQLIPSTSFSFPLYHLPPSSLLTSFSLSFPIHYYPSPLLLFVMYVLQTRFPSFILPLFFSFHNFPFSSSLYPLQSSPVFSPSTTFPHTLPPSPQDVFPLHFKSSPPSATSV